MGRCYSQLGLSGCWRNAGLPGGEVRSSFAILGTNPRLRDGNQYSNQYGRLARLVLLLSGRPKM